MKKISVEKIIPLKIISVSRYSYSQERVRRILRKMCKQGYVKFEGLLGKEFIYSYDTKEQFQEFIKRVRSK